MSELVGTFGTYLKQARLDKGLSIEEITEESKISKDVLLAIEAEDLTKLPDPVFVRGFLKSYAEMVGADAAAVVSMYKTTLGVDEQKPPKVKKEQRVATEADVETPAKKEGLSKFGLLLILLLFIGIICGSLWLMAADKKVEMEQETPVVEQPVSTNIPAEADTPTPEPVVLEKETTQEAATVLAAEKSQDESAGLVPAVEPVIAPEATEMVALVVKDVAPQAPAENSVKSKSKYELNISCTDKSWMKITIDGGSSREYLLPKGGSLKLDAEKNYDLVLGNAGGVSLALNGEDVKVSGKKGQVVSIQLP